MTLRLVDTPVSVVADANAGSLALAPALALIAPATSPARADQYAPVGARRRVRRFDRRDRKVPDNTQVGTEGPKPAA